MSWQRTIRFSLCLAISAAVSLSSPLPVLRAQGVASPLPALLKKHCIDCHGPQEAERNLRLDQLPLKFDEPETTAKWIKVLEMLSRGDMPPAGASQPTAQDRTAATTWLRTALHNASLATQQKQGRVLIRRLNRTEYDTTLSDLLGIDVSTRDLLPDDNSAAGFDNISSALDVSAAHMLRYQDAAERSCRGVIPTRPPTKINDRRTGKQVTEKMPTFKDLLGKVVKVDGDALIMYGQPYGHIPCSTAAVPQTGRYRVRALVRALNSPDKPLPILLSCRDQYGREDDGVREQAKSLASNLGSQDRERLDLLLSSIREAEARLALDLNWINRPKPKVEAKPFSDDYITGGRMLTRTAQWFDLVHLALQTDSTRVISLSLWSHESVTDVQGMTIPHHDASHHGQDETKIEQLAKIEEAEVQLFAGLLGKLKASAENERSLLDRTAIVYGSSLGNASAHTVDNLPIILAGGGFKHAGHIGFNRKENYQLSNLYVRLLQQLKFETDRFGNSDGVLSEV